MVKKVCRGEHSNKIYFEGEEAAIHRFLNENYQTVRKAGNNYTFPEPLIIERKERAK